MISYIFLLTSSLVFLFPNQEKKLKGENFFALIFSSFLFANLLLGFISLILILFGLSNLPIIILSISTTLLIFLIDKKFKNKLCKIRDFLKHEMINFLHFENENWKNKDDLLKGLKLVGDFMDKTILKPNNINHPLSRNLFINSLK